MVERLPGMGESKLGGEMAGAEPFSDRAFPDELFPAELCDCVGASELCDGSFGAEGPVDELGDILGASGRAKLFFVAAVFLLCDETLL